MKDVYHSLNLADKISLKLLGLMVLYSSLFVKLKNYDIIDSGSVDGQYYIQS